jgi:SAM-dependent methyltransferase
MTLGVDQTNLDAGNHVSYVEKIERYASTRGLTPCEHLIVQRYLPAGSTVLDLGVGTGRTVPELTRRAGRYVGIDHAPKMVARARELFPGADLRVLSAADLSDFGEASFDVVLFVFNGIDSLSPAARLACIAECARVLRDGGMFLLSRRNPRGIAPTVDPSFVPENQGAMVAARYAIGSAWRDRRSLVKRAFWTGTGRIDEPPFSLYAATRRRVRAEVVPFGFRHVDTVSCAYPKPAVRITTPWYYYAFQREPRLTPLP